MEQVPVLSVLLGLEQGTAVAGFTVDAAAAGISALCVLSEQLLVVLLHAADSHPAHVLIGSHVRIREVLLQKYYIEAHYEDSDSDKDYGCEECFHRSCGGFPPELYILFFNVFSCQLWPGHSFRPQFVREILSWSFQLEDELCADRFVVLDLVDNLGECPGHGNHLYLALVLFGIGGQGNGISHQYFLEG